MLQQLVSHSMSHTATSATRGRGSTVSRFALHSNRPMPCAVSFTLTTGTFRFSRMRSACRPRQIRIPAPF